MRRFVAVMSAMGLSVGAAGMALTVAVPSVAVSTPSGFTAPGLSRSADTRAEMGAARVARPRVLIMDCFWGRFKPRSIILACGDGNARVERLKWTRWGASTAAGHGIYVVNTCDPSCVQGRFVSYRMNIALSKPVSAANGTRYFTRIGLTFHGRGPNGSRTLQLSDCWDTPPSASYPKCPAANRGRSDTQPLAGGTTTAVSARTP